MTPTGKYIALSGVSGTVWGCLVTAVAFEFVPQAVWGGLIASPAIGCIIGFATLHWCRLRTPLRIAATLLSLYAAAVLFGLSVGLYDWLALDIPGRIAHGVVLQAAVAFPWGLTFLGWVVLLWPLGYLNHWLLGRISPTQPGSAIT